MRITSKNVKNEINQKLPSNSEPKRSSSPLLKSAFNSKLFINLDLNEEQTYLLNNDSLSSINTEDSENSFEITDLKNADYYLSNELISELDSSTASTPKNIPNNIMSSLLPLIKNGYEFVPKNFNPKNHIHNSTISNNNNKLNNLNNIIMPMTFIWNNFTLEDKRRERKNDWVCSFCHNLNFSFRTKCNRCKATKENSEKQKNPVHNYNFCY